MQRMMILGIVFFFGGTLALGHAWEEIAIPAGTGPEGLGLPGGTASIEGLGDYEEYIIEPDYIDPPPYHFSPVQRAPQNDIGASYIFPDKYYFENGPDGLKTRLMKGGQDDNE